MSGPHTTNTREKGGGSLNGRGEDEADIRGDRDEDWRGEGDGEGGVCSLRFRRAPLHLAGGSPGPSMAKCWRWFLLSDGSTSREEGGGKKWEFH